jgi:hypothetical protein
MRQRRTLHTNKRWNTPKGNNNYQPICTQHQCTQFHQTYIKDLKSHIDSNTVVVGDYNTSLSPIDRSPKQKINKEILELNHTIRRFKTATGTQPQTFWPPWSRDFDEKLETCLNEVKHQGELKHHHSEPLAPGRLLHPTIY